MGGESEMWNENRVTDLLHITYPIIQAGMAGGVTSPTLVAAVSNYGALGNIGAGYMTSTQLREHIREIKKRTDNPFGINVFVPETPEVHTAEIEKVDTYLAPFREVLNVQKVAVNTPSTITYEEQINVIMEEKVPVCSFTFGIPSKEVVQRLKQENIVLIGTATTVQEAMANEAIGMDIVVAQGSEAGGHRGTFLHSSKEALIGTTALVPQVVDRVQIPVIAAGGIMDGRGILSALILGAEGVQMGTAFVTSEESGANELHKEAILQSTEDASVVTKVFSGKEARGIRNDFVDKMEVYEDELPKYPIQNMLTQPLRKEAAKQQRPEWMSLWSGQGSRLSKRQSVRDMMDHIVEEIDHLIQHKLYKW